MWRCPPLPCHSDIRSGAATPFVTLCHVTWCSGEEAVDRDRDATSRDTKRSELVAGRQDYDLAVPLRRRLAMNLEDAISQVHDPVLGDRGTRIKQRFLPPIEGQRGLGDLDHQNG